MLNKLRDLRATRGWSQSDLADKLNVSRQTVNAIETGRYDPSCRSPSAIAKLFKLKIEDIFPTVIENVTGKSPWTSAETFVAFAAAINHHDVEALTALMTADHVFVDSAGQRVQGVEP